MFCMAHVRALILADLLHIMEDVETFPCGFLNPINLPSEMIYLINDIYDSKINIQICSFHRIQ